MRVLVSFEKSFIDILGTDIRRGVSMSSEEMLCLIKIDYGIKKLGVKFAATESAVEDMSKDVSVPFRFIGKFRDISGISWIKIYEIINTSNSLEKDLVLQTKNMFERAIQLYIDDDIREARNLFVNVLHKNEKDKPSLAMNINMII